jgi:mono/diheme cytochrome c family protein
VNRVAKWGARIGLGLVAAAVLASGAVYVSSEVIRRRHWPKQPITLVASTDPQAAARGERLARIMGCQDCHGADLTGRLFHDEPAVARIAGANLTLAAAHQSDADLARAIRTGVGSDGRGLWVMPSSAFTTLTDAETADLIAYVRSVKPAGGPGVGIQLGPIGRLGVALGQFHSEPATLAKPRPAAFDAGAAHAQGRALSRACMECHGVDLKGSGTGLKAPDLTMAASYPLADFKRFMRTGLAAGDRQLPMMSPTARARFAVLTDDEIAALHGYLQARAEQMP